LDILTHFLEWIGRSESVLSGIAASIVIVGVLFAPVSAIWRRRRAAAARASTTSEPRPQAAGGRPAIAVLPFTTPAGEDRHAALAEGLAGDLINALSRVRHFDVIARGATFAYRGRHVDVQEIARELGARYALEGSVREVGDGLRVTVQLVETRTRAPAWADRYDCPLDRGSATLDEVVARIAAAVQPALRRAEAARVRRSPASALDVWSLVNRAWVAVQNDLGSESVARDAAADCERALALDPDDALAHAVGAHARSLLLGAAPGASAGVEAVLASARRAVALGGHDPAVQHCYAAVLGNVGRTEDAVRAWERCLELDPNNAAARAGLGIALIYLRRPAEALASIERAIWLSPRDPLLYHWLAQRALACLLLGRTDEAAALARDSVERTGTRVGWGVLAAALAELGRIDAAREAWGELAARVPGLGPEALSSLLGGLSPDAATAERTRRAILQAAG